MAHDNAQQSKQSVTDCEPSASLPMMPRPVILLYVDVGVILSGRLDTIAFVWQTKATHAVAWESSSISWSLASEVEADISS